MEGNTSFCYQVRGCRNNIQPVKVSLKEGIWLKAQTIGCLISFSGMEAKSGLDIVLAAVFSSLYCQQ